ncbi:MAG: nitronate monooxygenase [Burkholderiales bacterium]
METGSRNVAAALCGVEHPVFQAGMAGIAGPELAAAVSNAGALGHLGGLRQPPSKLRAWIRETRKLTDRPFGVNLVPVYGGPEVFEAQLRIVFEERPKVLSLFYGDFVHVIPRAKAAGLVVMVQVGSVAEARKVFAEGADIVVAQGAEGGGHLHYGKIGLMSLLPAVVDVAKGQPVLAAGGIADRIDVEAAVRLGAHGVWVGTAFVATDESLAHEIYKRRLVEASTDDTEYRTGYSFGWTFGTPHRVIPNRDRWNLVRFVGGGARVVDKPAIAKKLSLFCGQGVGKIADIVPAARLVARLAAGFSGNQANRAHVGRAA